MSEKVIDYNNLETGDMVISADGINKKKHKDNLTLKGREEDTAAGVQKDIGRTLAEPIFGDVKGVYTSDGKASSIASGIVSYLYSSAVENSVSYHANRKEKAKLNEEYSNAIKEANIDQMNRELTELACGGKERFEKFQVQVNGNEVVSLNYAFQESIGKGFDFHSMGKEIEYIDMLNLKRCYNEYFSSSECKFAFEVDLKDKASCQDFLTKVQSGEIHLSLNDKCVLENYVSQFDYIQKTPTVRLLTKESSVEDIFNATKTLCLHSENEYMREIAKRGFDARDINRYANKIAADDVKLLKDLTNEYKKYTGNVPILNGDTDFDKITNLRKNLSKRGFDKKTLDKMFKGFPTKEVRDRLEFLKNNPELIKAMKDKRKAKGKMISKIKNAMLKDVMGIDFYQGFQTMTTITKTGIRIVKSIVGGPMRKLGKNIGKALKKTKTFTKVSGAIKNVVGKIAKPFKSIGQASKKIVNGGTSKLKKTKLSIKRSKGGKFVRKGVVKGKSFIRKATTPFRKVSALLQKPKQALKNIAAKAFKPFAKIGQAFSKVIGIVSPYIALAILAIILTGFLGPFMADIYTSIGGNPIYPEDKVIVSATDFEKDIVYWINKQYSEHAYYEKINNFCASNNIGTWIEGDDKPSIYADYTDYNIAYYDCDGNRLDGYHSNLKDIMSIVYAYICQGRANGLNLTAFESEQMYQEAINLGIPEEDIITAYKFKYAEYETMKYLITVLWDASNVLELKTDANGRPYIEWTTYYLTAVELDKYGYPARFEDGTQLDFTYQEDGVHDTDDNIYTLEELDDFSSLSFYESSQSDGKHGLCPHTEHIEGQGSSGCLLRIYTEAINNLPQFVPDYEDLFLVQQLSADNFFDNLKKMEAFYNGKYTVDLFMTDINEGKYFYNNGENALSIVPISLANTVKDINYYDYRNRIWALMDADWSRYEFYSPDAYYSETMNDGEIQKALKKFFNSENFENQYKQYIQTTVVDEVNVSLLTVEDEYQFRFAVAYWALRSVGNIPYYDIPDNFEDYLAEVKESTDLKKQYDYLYSQYITHFYDDEISAMNSRFHSEVISSVYNDSIGAVGIQNFADKTLPFPSTKGVIGSKNPGLNEDELIWWIYESATSSSTYYYGDSPLLIYGNGHGIYGYQDNSFISVTSNKQALDLTKVKPGDLLISTYTGEMAVYIGYNMGANQDQINTPWIVMMSNMYMNSSYMPATSYSNNEIKIENRLDNPVVFTHYISLTDIMTQFDMFGMELKSKDSVYKISEFTSEYVLDGEAEVKNVTYKDGIGNSVNVDAVQQVETYKITNMFPTRAHLTGYQSYLNNLTKAIVTFDLFSGYGLGLSRTDLDGNTVCDYSLYRNGDAYTIRHKNGNEGTCNTPSLYLTRNIICGVPYKVDTYDANGNVISSRTITFTGDTVITIGNENCTMIISLKEGYKAKYSYTTERGGEPVTGELTETTSLTVPSNAGHIYVDFYKTQDENWEHICESQAVAVRENYETPAYPSKDYCYVTVEASQDIRFTIDGNNYTYEDTPFVFIAGTELPTIITYTYKQYTVYEEDFIFQQLFTEDCTITLPEQFTVTFKNKTGSFINLEFDGHSSTLPITPSGEITVTVPVGNYFYKHNGKQEIIVTKDMEIELN